LLTDLVVIALASPVQVCVFGFDCLYHNGVSLLHEPLTKRRDVLHSSIREVAGQVSLATTKISNDVEELEVRRAGAVPGCAELCGVAKDILAG
jgi:ATP-dependent DNA ligase